MSRRVARLKVPKLPALLESKLYKTGQTRGADDDAIFQNRVSRSSTVLIPWNCWDICAKPEVAPDAYQSGFIVLLSPSEFFEVPTTPSHLTAAGLQLGGNALVFYESRAQWTAYNPATLDWVPATKRRAPLGGQFVARIPATTSATDGTRIVEGFNVTSHKGAGIRVYEYADSTTISLCRLQLEALFWLCLDSFETAIANGMAPDDAKERRSHNWAACEERGLLDFDKLLSCRSINAGTHSVCPLCLAELSAAGFFARMPQAVGRTVSDLTVTELNLFHVEELKTGSFNHRPYNLGWGHHHCNVVVKDVGIFPTLDWMRSVINRNQ